MSNSTTDPPEPEPHRHVPHASELHWIGPLQDDTDELQAAEGRHRVRTLVQLRRDLPVSDGDRRGVPPISTRAIDLSADATAVIEVNNAAFDWHPEQGGWTHDRFASEMSTEWVDLKGFRVHDEPNGGVDGFCWTRIHPEGYPPGSTKGLVLGEIYVIAAHPRSQGSGLGAALVLAGLDHMGAHGITEALLWTEEDDEPARRMYDRLGFHLHERRGGYR